MPRAARARARLGGRNAEVGLGGVHGGGSPCLLLGGGQEEGRRVRSEEVSMRGVLYSAQQPYSALTSAVSGKVARHCSR